MELLSVNSSNIAGIGYDRTNGVLIVDFNKGGTYAYDNVPEEVYVGLLNAPSAGEYHALNIKNSYPYRRID